LQKLETNFQVEKGTLAVSKIIEKIYEAIISFSILLMALILIGNVVSRTIFNTSWSFAEEVGQSLVIIVTFTGVGYCALKAKHINMSAIYDLAPRSIKKALMILNSGITSGIMFYLAFLGMQYAMRVKELGRVTPALRVPTYILCLVVAVGFSLAAIEYARTFYKNLTKKEIYISSTVTENSNNTLNDESINIL
jgi:C4-dicarboxylate transporter, DctQ subunit